MPHIHEKIDFVADVFIVHKGKVLLRKHEKFGIWLGPGGHVELDEDPSQAAVREAKEEVGLDVVLAGAIPSVEGLDAGTKLLLAPRFMQRHRVSETHEHVALYYFATSESDEVRPGGDDRSDVWKWFTAEELDDPQYGIRPDIRFYAHAALRELGEKE